MHEDAYDLRTRRIIGKLQLATGLAREPRKELLQWPVLDLEIRCHRLRPCPLTPGGGDRTLRHGAVAIDHHFRARIDRGVAVAPMPLHAALAHTQASHAIDERHRELRAEMSKLAGGRDDDEAVTAA